MFVSWKMAPLAFIFYTGLINHTLESSSLVSHAPGCNQEHAPP